MVLINRDIFKDDAILLLKKTKNMLKVNEVKLDDIITLVESLRNDT